MQTAFKLSFAMSIINGWDAFHRDVGEKLTYGKLVKACNAVSDQLSSLVQDPRVCFNCYPLLQIVLNVSTGWMQKAGHRTCNSLVKLIFLYR